MLINKAFRCIFDLKSSLFMFESYIYRLYDILLFVGFHFKYFWKFEVLVLRVLLLVLKLLLLVIKIGC